MKLPTYILFNNLDDIQMIMQTAWPSYVAYILPNRIEADIPATITHMQIAGYSIHIVLAGVLNGHMLPWSVDPLMNYRKAVEEMASWYLVEVIGKDLESYSRFSL